MFFTCKNSKKNLDSYYFVTLFDFLSLENSVNVPSNSNKQKQDPDPDPLVRGVGPRIRIRIHFKMSWIWNTGFLRPDAL
jgi:hypothetical protein